MTRLDDFKEAGQLEREKGAVCGALRVGLGEGMAGEAPKDDNEVRSQAESVKSNRKLVLEL